MPAFYGAGLSASHMPITPPDSGSGYGYSDMHYRQDPYASQQSLSQPRHDGAYDYQQSYMQAAVAPAPPAYPYQSNYQSANSLPPISSYHEPIGAPILPPLRIHDRMSFADDYQRRLQQEQQTATAREQQRQAPKEEKATGGVSAKLDYDMERMTDFVTDATMTIFHHKMQSPPSFRKWVHQVLSATRLPSSTIMLSLHYLNDRVAHFAETVGTSENGIYRLLAVALILGSKFLDDNTFINRSWSDVTAIKVQELNQLEAKWLEMIHWELHVDSDAPNGLSAWLRAWQDFQQKDAAKQQAAARLSPLDTTNVQRHSMQRDRCSPYAAPYSATSSRTYEAQQSSRAPQYATSSWDNWGVDNRHSYDDYYRRQNRYSSIAELDTYSRSTADERARQSMYSYPHTAHPSYYQQPSYGSAWDQPAWNAAHRYDCSCSACLYQQHYRPYPMTSSYSAQTVMG